MSITLLAAYSLVISGVLAAGAWLLDRALTTLRLPARGVWLAALVLCIGLPVVAVISESRPRDPSGPAEHGQAPLTALEPSPALTEASWDGEFRLSAALHPLLNVRQWTGRLLESGASVIPRGGKVEVWSLAAWGAASLLVGLWLAVSVLRLRRRARDWPIESVLGHTVRVAPDLGPATVGALNPVIIIPRWARELPRGELELVVRHEDEHVRSRDTLLLAAGLAATVVYPWNPLIWWQFRRMRDAVEVDCDRRVLQHGVQPGSYGHLLLSLASRCRAFSPAVPTMAGSPSLLERRLIIMKRMRDRVSLTQALVGTTVGSLLIVVACTTEMPVGSDTRPDPGLTATSDSQAAPDENQPTVAVTVDQDGAVRVNGVVHPIEGVAAVAAAAAEGADRGVSVVPHPSAPFGVVSEVVERLGSAGLRPLVFRVAEFDAVGTPSEAITFQEAPAGPEPEASPGNLLFLNVESFGGAFGAISVRRAEGERGQTITPAQAERVVEHLLSSNPDLIGIVRVAQDAPYEAVAAVLAGIRKAGLTRFSVQMVE